VKKILDKIEKINLLTIYYEKRKKGRFESIMVVTPKNVY